MQRSRVRWLVAATVVAAIAAGVAGAVTELRVDAADGRSLEGPIFNSVVFGLFAVVGAVVIAARPRNRVGWAMLGGGVLSLMAGAAVSVARHGMVDDPGSVAGLTAWAVGGQTLRGWGWMSVTLLAPAWFPDRVTIERRWIGCALVVIAVCSLLDPLLDPRATMMGTGTWRNPLAPHAPWNVLGGLSFLLHLPLTVVTTVGVVRLLIARWRAGDELRRQQIALFAAAAAVPAIAGPLALAAPIGGWVFGISAMPLPIAMGFAVLARGLYDLRTAANRTLVWLTLSAIVAAIYALVIGGGAALLHVDRDAPLLLWVAAVAMALLFVPLRDLLQRGVNQVTFGRWEEPYEVLAALGQRVEASGDVNRLLEELVQELESLGLRGIAVTDTQGQLLVGAAPAGQAGLERIDLHAYNTPIGCLYYASANPLRARDRRLLDDLAGHIGSVLYARSLTADLQAALERVVLGREEERRRLRRDLHDGLGPALAGHLLRLEALAGRVRSDDELRRDLDSLRSELSGTVLEVRRVVEGLRPPALDDLGLAGALEQAGRRLTHDSNVSLEMRVGELGSLSAAVEVAAYRIVTEALTNVVRHAAARSCVVSLAVEGAHLVVTIADNGVGFAEVPGSAGHGMQTMRERAEELGGTMDVMTADGTTVRARLPLAPVVAS